MGRIRHYTCVECGHNASLTTSRSGLAIRITIRPHCVLNAFTPVLTCGQALSDCDRITENACEGQV